MTIPDQVLQTLCRLGKGAETCSYVGRVPEGWACMKGIQFTDIRMAIDERRADGTMTAKGDNCEGPPDYELCTPDLSELKPSD